MSQHDESNKDYIVNNMAVDLNVYDALMKGRIICNEDGNLILKIHRHSLQHQKIKLI